MFDHVGIICGSSQDTVSEMDGHVSEISDMFRTCSKLCFTYVSIMFSIFRMCSRIRLLDFQANIWNIGAEGQLTIGALAGGGMALLFFNVDTPFLIPAMLISGVLGGMVWAAIPALLKTKFGTNEILTSLMLTYVGLCLHQTCGNSFIKHVKLC